VSALDDLVSRIAWLAAALQRLLNRKCVIAASERIHYHNFQVRPVEDLGCAWHGYRPANCERLA